MSEQKPSRERTTRFDVLDEIIQGLLADRDQMLARIAALEAGE